MGEHLKAFSAIFPMIIKVEGNRTDILLHRRKNTGYQDGKWDIAGSGHVDKGETAQAAVIRECREELGINVKIEDLTFAHLSHRLCEDRTYYDIYFVVNKYTGIPTIIESDKCSDLNWFDIQNLPNDTIECRKLDILNFTTKKYYSEKVDV